MSSYLQLRSASLIDAQSKVSVAINTLSAMKTKTGITVARFSEDYGKYRGVELRVASCGIDQIKKRYRGKC
jgi:hypothetical protein